MKNVKFLLSAGFETGTSHMLSRSDHFIKYSFTPPYSFQITCLGLHIDSIQIELGSKFLNNYAKQKDLF